MSGIPTIKNGWFMTLLYPHYAERLWQKQPQQVRTLLEDEFSSSEAWTSRDPDDPDHPAVIWCSHLAAGVRWVRDILVKDRNVQIWAFLDDSTLVPLKLWSMLCTSCTFLLQRWEVSEFLCQPCHPYGLGSSRRILADSVVPCTPDDLPCLQVLQTICSDLADRELRYPSDHLTFFQIITPWSTWIWPKHFRNWFSPLPWRSGTAHSLGHGKSLFCALRWQLRQVWVDPDNWADWTAIQETCSISLGPTEHLNGLFRVPHW